MRILVTGSAGFIGKNLCVDLARRGDTLLTFDTQDDEETLRERVTQADMVFHLAGVNRPQNPAEFTTGNTELTDRVLALLRARETPVPFILSSSTQAALDNPYGQSKRAAEEAAFAYGRASGAPVYVFRFPGVFGKWCRPFYNSVVATFCHQAAHGEDLRIDDPDKALTLVYIDDILAHFRAIVEGTPAPAPGEFSQVQPTHTVTLGDLAGRLRGFAASRTDYTLTGDRADAFTRKLYATFLSYLPQDGFAVSAVAHADARGSFSELIRSVHAGQLSVSVTKPGITRGQHWHHTKVEKFIVVAGEGVIRFRRLDSDQVLTYPVSGSRIDIVDIPPGYTHNITNTGTEDLLLLIWAGELFDPTQPDTYYEEV